MLSLPPYSSWPLHVKLFHADAVREWGEATAIVPNPHLPAGLTVSVEFEGVDGTGTRPSLTGATSAPSESARTMPIDVKDSEYTIPEFTVLCEQTWRSCVHCCSAF